MLRTLLPAALLAFCTPLFAQAPSDAPKPKAERRFDCSKAKDPKACEERLAKAKAAHEKARKACEGKKGEEGRDCMRREMCAQSKDPKGCEEHATKMKAELDKARKTCEGKPQGQERRDCVRQEMRKQEK